MVSRLGAGLLFMASRPENLPGPLLNNK